MTTWLCSTPLDSPLEDQCEGIKVCGTTKQCREKIAHKWNARKHQRDNTYPINCRGRLKSSSKAQVCSQARSSFGLLWKISGQSFFFRWNYLGRRWPSYGIEIEVRKEPRSQTTLVLINLNHFPRPMFVPCLALCIQDLTLVTVCWT